MLEQSTLIRKACRRTKLNIDAQRYSKTQDVPFEMMSTATSFCNALSVKSARNRLCSGTVPEVFSRVDSSDVSVSCET